MRTLFEAPTPERLAAVAGPVTVTVPPNLIPAAADQITPAMLPLVQLTEEQIAALVAQVDGGAANVADVYPLAPLQEGMFFHHLMAGPDIADVYLQSYVLRTESQERLDEFIAALEQVIARHDVLRTSVVWDGLPEPVQVVWREAWLSVTEITLSVTGNEPGSAIAALRAAAPARMDLGWAPLLRLTAAADPDGGGHLVLVQMHHLVLDHVGLEMVLGEVAAMLAGQAGELPEPLPFRDFVAQARLGTPREEHERYFAGLLGDVTVPAAPYGLLDIHDPGQVRHAHQPVDPELAERLRALARTRSTSPATIVHLAWARVLMVLAGQEDVVFGTVLLGRMNAGPGADRVPGLYMNTLPVRVRGADAGVADALAALRSQLAGLLAHEHAPLVLAQQASGIPADLPLFTTLLNYRHSGPGGTRIRDARVRRTGVAIIGGQDQTNYPLHVSVDDRGTGFGIAADAVAPADPDQLCALLGTCLDNLVTVLDAAPATPLHAVPVLDEAQRSQLVDGWNDTAAPMPAVTLAELFEVQVGQSPEAVAVDCEGVFVSYAVLNEQANRLARVLTARGAGPEQVVAVVMDRSTELVTALLAVLKTGAAYLPADPGYPSERIAFMLADARPVLALATVGTAAVIPTAVPVLTIGDQAIAAEPPGAGGAAADPGGSGRTVPLSSAHPAYVIYTSGSTGRPKGVAVPHAGIVNRLLWMQAEYGLDGADAVLHKTPTSFDVSVWELFWPLLAGARLVLARPGGQGDPGYLSALIAAAGVTTAHFVPSMLEVFTDAADPKECVSLRRVICSGEALPGAAAQRFTGRFAAGLHNLYGPTETSVDSTAWACAADAGTLPIGRPIANTRVFVLDRWLCPVPAGVTGELYIAGAGLARGYQHQPP